MIFLQYGLSGDDSENYKRQMISGMAEIFMVFLQDWFLCENSCQYLLYTLSDTDDTSKFFQYQLSFWIPLHYKLQQILFDTPSLRI